MIPDIVATKEEPTEPREPTRYPSSENSDQMLRDICYNKAHEIYGDNLPIIVKERLERELNSIISNGYAVMYIIAQKLVWKPKNVSKGMSNPSFTRGSPHSGQFLSGISHPARPAYVLTSFESKSQ